MSFSTASSTPLSLNERIHYLDHVRAWAMLAGIFLHASLAYAPRIQEFWLVKDSTSSPLMGVFFVFIHLFRMGLFFLVAGFFANLLIQKRGIGSFLKNRTVRLALPFMIFLPLLTITIIGLSYYMKGYLTPEEYPIRLFNSNSDVDTARGNLQRLSTVHLWFIYYLMMFCVITALTCRLRLTVVKKYFNRFFSNPKHLIYFPLLLVPALYGFPAPVPTPTELKPQVWPFGYYGLFFLVGWFFFYQPSYLDKLKTWIWPMSIFCLLGTFLLLIIIRQTPGENGVDILNGAARTPVGFSIKHLIAVLLQAYLGTYLVMLALYFGRATLNFESKAMRYISDASYWIYIIHIPLLIIVQLYMVRLAWPPLLKFSLSTAIVFILALAIYETIVRYTPIGTMLNGKKTRGEKAASEVIAAD